MAGHAEGTRMGAFEFALQGTGLDLARLAHEGLQGEALAEFVARSQRLLLGS